MKKIIFTATGCARCKITKRFMQQQNIDYDEFDIKAEGKDAFARFYRENRNAIYRDADGVEFPVYSDGSAIRQGVGAVIGYLIAGDGLRGFITRSTLHGEWIDGFDISGGNPANAGQLLQVLAFLKQNGLKIQAVTDGRNAAVLEQMIDKRLVDRVIMEVRGPEALYGCLLGEEIASGEIFRSIALTIKFPEYAFYTQVAPIARADGTVSYLTHEEIEATAKMIEAAGGSKKHPYRLRRCDPTSIPDDRIQSIEPLPDSAMFKYRTAARRYQVLTEIDK
jgi:glutaredoxin